MGRREVGEVVGRRGVDIRVKGGRKGGRGRAWLGVKALKVKDLDDHGLKQALRGLRVVPGQRRFGAGQHVGEGCFRCHQGRWEWMGFGRRREEVPTLGQGEKRKIKVC